MQIGTPQLRDNCASPSSSVIFFTGSVSVSTDPQIPTNPVSKEPGRDLLGL